MCVCVCIYIYIYASLMLVGRINKVIGKDVTGNGIGPIVGSPQFRHLSGRTKKLRENSARTSHLYTHTLPALYALTCSVW